MNTRLFCLLFSLVPVLGLDLAAAEPATPPNKAEAGKKTVNETKTDVTDPKQALADIPRDVMKDLRPGSRESAEAMVKATAQVRKNVEGKTGKFEFTVTGIEKFQRKDTPDVNRTRIRSNSGTVREGGATLKVFLMGAVVDAEEKEKLSKIKAGSKVTVTGVISNGEITMPRKDLELHIDMMDAKLVD